MAELSTLHTDYGTVTVAVDTDWTIGETRYTVDGAGVKGPVVVAPHFAHDHVDLDVALLRITFASGTDTRTSPLRPTVDGIPLHGTTTCRLDRLRAGWRDPHDLGMHFARHDLDILTDWAARRVAAVVIAVATHWADRPDNTQVRLAAARLAARDPHRLAANAAQIEQTAVRIAELTEHLERYQAHAQQMRELAASPPTPPRPASDR